MSNLNKIFCFKGKYNLAKECENTKKETVHIYEPVKEICKAIICASNNCTQILTSDIKFRVCPHEDKQLAEIAIFYEYTYFFIHLTLRFRFNEFTETQMRKFEGYLGPLLINSTIDKYFNHLPQDLMGKKIDEFYDNLNLAELEYTECKEMLDEEDPFSDKALFSKLAKKVLKMAGFEVNRMQILAAMFFASDEFKKIAKVVDEASSTLPRT